MKKTILVSGILTLSLALLLPACEGETTPTVDSGVKVDTFRRDTSPDTGLPTKSRDFVIKSMVVPTTDADVKTYAYDIDGNGKVDNALGAILMAIKTAAPGVDMQKDMNQNILNGNVISLAQVKATDLQTATSASIQAWTGKKVACCTTKPCKDADVKTTCFSGTYSFEPDANSPTNAVLTGSIADSKFTFGPGTIEVQLPIGKYPARVKLLKAKIEGKLTTDGIIEGKMMGAIGQSDLMNQVVPSVAQVLSGEMNDPTTAQTTKDAIKAAFDTNKDGSVSADEVKNNAGVKAVLAGDVDADGDGKAQELSAGVGFVSTTCTVKTN